METEICNEEERKKAAHRKRQKKWTEKNPNYQGEYYKSNFEKITERNKQWRKNNPEKQKEMAKRYRLKNSKEISEKRKIYYQNNSEEEKESTRRWQKNNPEKVNEYSKNWTKNNREKVNKYKKNRRKDDLIFRLNENIGNVIRQSLKENKKGRHWETFVNYTLDELKKHLESTMPEGYTWEDYLAGGLHIDHKIPKSIFNITSAKSKGFQKCWALENLQFLPALENIRKADKLFV